MAIGISYTGHDGRRVDFMAEGNPAPGSELDRIVRGADAGADEARRVLTPLSDAMRRARRPQGPDPRIDRAAGTVKLDLADHRPGTLADKVDVGGSIEAGRTGLKLKGEDATSGDGIYAKRNGERGFLTLDQIDDPKLKGGLVGEPDAMNRLAPSNKAEGESGAFAENMQSRTEAEVNEETGEVTFWEYTKKWDVTSGRRVGGVSGETKRKICSFFLGGGDRQITYWRHRELFSVVRSHYTDENGRMQYEFWMRVPKWGIRSKDDKELDGHSLVYSSDLDNNSYRCTGAYAFGDYGHYPQRPLNRPRKLVFDDGREALVDTFEERSMATLEDSTCNCWTYIGSSEDGAILGEPCPDGNITLYGAKAFYNVPFKKAYVEERDYSSGRFREVTPAHWSYETRERDIAVAMAKQYDRRELLRFLVSRGALIASAYQNEGYDSASYERIEYLDGVEIGRVREFDVYFQESYTALSFAPADYLENAPFSDDDGYFYNYDIEDYSQYTGDPMSYFPFMLDTWARKDVDYNFPESTNPYDNHYFYDEEYYDDFYWIGMADGYWTHIAQPVCKIEGWEIVDDMADSYASSDYIYKHGNRLFAAIENVEGDVLELDVTYYGMQFLSRVLSEDGVNRLSGIVLKNDLVMVKGK